MKSPAITHKSRRHRSRRISSLGGVSDVARSKDIRLHPGFRGEISRALWRIWYGRLTPAGQYILIVTALFSALGSNSLQVQAYVPVSYLLALWIVSVVSVVLYKPRVELKTSHVDRIRTGELMPVEVEVRQLRKLFRSELTVIPSLLPPGLDAEPLNGASTRELRFKESERLQFGIRCSRRGTYSWGGYRVETDFPFGMLRAYRNYLGKNTVMVFPSFSPLMQLNIPVGRRYQPGGVAMSSDLGESFEYVGNRDYREGDNVRNIDWTATARLNTPVVREYRDEFFLRVGVVLDTHIPRRSSEEHRDNFERAISICASVSDFMARSDYLVDIFAAGPNLYHLTAGRSLAYLDQILDILACVNYSQDEVLTALEPALTEYLSRLTTVICVFIDWTESRRDFVHRLAQEGTGVKVIVVRDVPCTLDPTSEDAYGGITKVSKAAFDTGLTEI